MFEEEDIAFNGLEVCSYRQLQQLAKGMGLPSNVKKVYLIEMINAKKYSTEDEVNEIVNRVKMERKVNALTKKNKVKKKKRLQGTEISSTSASLSPQISSTPKRPNFLIQFSPDRTNLSMRYKKPNIIRSSSSIRQPMKSDRVLRSFNTVKRPNYRIMEHDNCFYDVVNARNTVQEIRRERYQSVTIQKHRPMMEARVVMNMERQLVPMTRNSNNSPQLAARQRRLSGIYPLQPTTTVSFRGQDGRVSKINAIIQKQTQALVPKKNTPKHRPIVVTVQDVINYKVDQTDKMAKTRNIEHSRYQNYGQKAIDNKAHSQIDKTNTLVGNYHSSSDLYAHKVSLQSRNIEPALSRSIYSETPRRSTHQRIDPNIYTFSELTPKVAEQSNYFDKPSHKTYTRNRESNQNDTYSNNMNDYRPEPNSRDFQVPTFQYEYQRFNQQITERSRFENADYTNVESQYPNMAALTDIYPNDDNYTNESLRDSNAIYYHKKIRAEQVRTQKTCEELPRINDVFTQFKDVEYKNLDQPLYVEVSKESERVPLPVANTNQTGLLESLYNFKNQFLTNVPILQIVTTHTQPTYSAHTVTTAIANSAAATEYNSTPYERVNSYVENDYAARFDEYLRDVERQRANIGCDEVLSSSTASLETTNSQDLGANVTIPEMVEDALELISQDGDYMERIGMDVRLQCILCGWAGPKLLLEQHIHKEHPKDIQHTDNSEWSVLFTLGELISGQGWSNQLIQYRGNMFVVSAMYRHTDIILVSLSRISSDINSPKHARITVYNKISGKPYSYESEIKQLPDSMPCDCDYDCLILDIGSLDLIPNSANLRLVNRELVVRSPNKVVVGPPQLNNVEIVVYVKLLD